MKKHLLLLHLQIQRTIAYTHKQGRNVMFHQRDLSVSASTSAVTSWFRSPYQKMGKSRIVVIEPGAKVNSQYYCRNVLGDGLLPDIRAICQHHTWTLQQDGAPSHTAKNTMEYLRRENISFIEPDMWPPNS